MLHSRTFWTKDSHEYSPSGVDNLLLGTTCVFAKNRFLRAVVRVFGSYTECFNLRVHVRFRDVSHGRSCYSNRDCDWGWKSVMRTDTVSLPTAPTRTLNLGLDWNAFSICDFIDILMVIA